MTLGVKRSSDESTTADSAHNESLLTVDDKLGSKWCSHAEESAFGVVPGPTFINNNLRDRT
jgi:hypothetical protein